MANLWQWLVTLAASSGVPEALLNDNQAWGKLITWGGTTLNNPDKRSHVVEFYLNWHSVLHTNMMAMQKIVGTVNGWITFGLYHLVQGLESVFMAVLQMFGIFSKFNSGSMGKLYQTIVGIAFCMLAIGLAYLLVENIFRAKTKIHDVMTNLVVVIAVLIMLPFGTNLFSQFVTAGSNEILGNTKDQTTSIAVQPIKNNVVDTISLAKKGFKVNPKKLDGHMSDYNAISNRTIDDLDLSEVVASDNLSSNSTPKGVDNVFKHTVTMGSAADHYSVIDATLPSKQGQLTKAFDAVYPRYTGHFVVADGQLLFIGIMFIFIAFRVAMSWFEILLLNFSAPMMGMQDLRSNQRLKEVMQAIQGSLISVMVEVIGLRVFLIVLNYLGSADNLGTKFLSQYPNSAVPNGIFLIIMYIASFMAFLHGVSLVERWTGVPQGKGSGLFSALATGGMIATLLGNHSNKKAQQTATDERKDDQVAQKREDGMSSSETTTVDPTKNVTEGDAKADMTSSAPKAARDDQPTGDTVNNTPDSKHADDTKGSADEPHDKSDTPDPTEADDTGDPDDTTRDDGDTTDVPDPTKADDTEDSDDITRDDGDTTDVPDPTKADDTGDPDDITREDGDMTDISDPTKADDTGDPDNITRDDGDTTDVPDPTKADDTEDSADITRDDGDTTDVPDPTHADDTKDSDDMTRDDGDTTDVPDPTHADDTKDSDDTTRDDGDTLDVPDPTHADDTKDSDDTTRDDGDTLDTPDSTHADDTKGSSGTTRDDGDTTDASDSDVERDDESSDPLNGTSTGDTENNSGTDTSTVESSPNDSDNAQQSQVESDNGSSKLAKAGMVMNVIGQKGQQSGQTMVNLPNMKVDDSIY